MRSAGIGVVAIALAVTAPGEAAPREDAPSCGLEDPAIAEQAPPVPRKPREVAGLGAGGLPVVRRVRAGDRLELGTVGHGAAGGALAGKTIYVSAGHGWTWVDSLSSWHTQRGNTHDLVEDFISSETIATYLLHYLINMGAHVVPVRESDLNDAIDVVDDSAGAGRFETTGNPQLTDEGTGGYGAPVLPITGADNPFALGGARVMPAAASETARVTWVFDVPEDGDYNVYVGYVQDPSRASDAHYIVHHAGGDAHFRVDQRRHGSTWVLLGRYHFTAGMSPVYGALSLADDSSDGGAMLSVDVARIGGGVGVIDRGGGANGRPMFENNARYNAQLSGAPASVYDYSSTDGSDDVGTRSRFSAWDHEDGEDAVYIAWHTNAPSPARGTSSFAYGPDAYGDISQFTGVPGSLELMDAVHTELVSDFRTAWEADWQDRGQHTAYFGEVNPNHNPEMPAVLFEIAFHDTAEDADALRDPRFRRIAARALAHGVARYFAARDGADLTLPPEPPTALRMEQGDGGLVLSWRPPVDDPAGGDPADGYRVYLSADGIAFDDGRPVTGESFAIQDRPIGDTVFARVTAVNTGGESLASAVVGARVSTTGRARVLVVGGFDRIDNRMLLREDLSAYDLATIERAFVSRINDGSHLARHGLAVAAANVSFDSAQADAVVTGDVDLTRYDAVDWFVGEESAAYDPLDDAERAALTAFLDGGGKLLVTGSELGWSLVDQGLAPDFYGDALHASYVADDAGSYAVTGVAAPFDTIADFSFDDSGPGGYDADWPDVIDAAAGGAVVLRYGADAGGAATLWSDADGARQVFVFGFPFETIAGADVRADVMARVLATFDVPADEPIDPGGDDAGPGGGGTVTAGCGCRAGGSGAGGSGWPWLLGVFSGALWHRRRSSSRPKRSKPRSSRSRR